MKTRKTSIIILFILITSLIPISAASTQPEKQEVVIIFKDSPRPELVKSHGGEIKYQYQIIPGIAAILPTQAIEALRKNPNILTVEENIRFTATTQTTDWGITQIKADQAHTSGYKGTGVKVAILDTGIDYTHPDLADNYDPLFWSFTDSPMDDHGHGTHCAGIVAATDNTFGVIGVAPEATLHAVKVLDSSGSGWLTDIIAGIDWSVSNGMDVISMSLGSNSYSSSFEQACNEAYSSGVVLVAAAGNDYKRLGRRELNTIDHPGAYTSVIAVGATDKDNQKASWSSTGPEIELAAPGVSILSTYPNNRYVTMSGTSMATPHVAGVAALILATPIDTIYDQNSNGKWDPPEVRAKLRDTADDLGDTGFDYWYGYGLVDALESCTGTNDITPPAITEQTPAPSSTITINNPTISARVQDPSGVDTVTMTLDGAEVGSFIGETVSYQTTALNEGTHTVVVSATDSLGNQGTSSWSFTIDTTTPPPSNELTATLTSTIQTKKAGPNLFVWAQATITVTGDGPMAGATVTGRWSTPASGTLTATTDANGQVKFDSTSIKNPESATFTFVLEDVTYPGWVYIAGTQTTTSTYP